MGTVSRLEEMALAEIIWFQGICLTAITLVDSQAMVQRIHSQATSLTIMGHADLRTFAITAMCRFRYIQITKHGTIRSTSILVTHLL